MRASRAFRVFLPRKLSDVAAAERSKYLDAKINAAIGSCPEPKHPLDKEEKPAAAARYGAHHRIDGKEI